MAKKDEMKQFTKFAISYVQVMTTVIVSTMFFFLVGPFLDRLAYNWRKSQLKKLLNANLKLKNTV